MDHTQTMASTCLTVWNLNGQKFPLHVAAEKRGCCSAGCTSNWPVAQRQIPCTPPSTNLLPVQLQGSQRLKRFCSALAVPSRTCALHFSSSNLTRPPSAASPRPRVLPFGTQFPHTLPVSRQCVRTTEFIPTTGPLPGPCSTAIHRDAAMIPQDVDKCAGQAARPSQHHSFFSPQVRTCRLADVSIEEVSIGQEPGRD